MTDNVTEPSFEIERLSRRKLLFENVREVLLRLPFGFVALLAIGLVMFILSLVGQDLSQGSGMIIVFFPILIMMWALGLIIPIGIIMILWAILSSFKGNRIQVANKRKIVSASLWVIVGLLGLRMLQGVWIKNTP